MELVPGLYEELVTVGLDRDLRRLPAERHVVRGPVDEAESPDVLAGHVARPRRSRHRLRAVPAPHRKRDRLPPATRARSAPGAGQVLPDRAGFHRSPAHPFPVRPAAARAYWVSRDALPTTVRAGFPFLPAGCHIDLDPVAADIVLRNVRSQVGVTKLALAADVRSHRQVSLAEYLRHSGRELGDIYCNGGSWTALCRAAGLTAPPAGPDDDALPGRLSRLAHTDDPERLDGYRHLVAGPAPPEVHALTPRQQRLAAMLVFTFRPDGGGHASYDAALEQLWRHPAIRAELTELLGLAAEDTRHVTLQLPGAFEPCPLGAARPVQPRGTARRPRCDLPRSPPVARPRRGAVGGSHNADVFTFALHKSERDYSSTTMYRDYAISPSLVHWESQSTTGVDSPTGQRYLHHSERA